MMLKSNFRRRRGMRRATAKRRCRPKVDALRRVGRVDLRPRLSAVAEKAVYGAGQGDVGGDDADEQLKGRPEGGDRVRVCVVVSWWHGFAWIEGGLQLMSSVWNRRDRARATPKPVALGGVNFGLRGRITMCTYKRPMDMSPLINTLVCSGIRTFHTATSGSREHKRSVTRLYAAVR